MDMSETGWLNADAALPACMAVALLLNHGPLVRRLAALGDSFTDKAAKASSRGGSDGSSCSTYLTDVAKEADNKLAVSSTLGLSRGDKVLIGEGTRSMMNEVSQVIKDSVVLLARPLNASFSAGDPVEKVDASIHLPLKTDCNSSDQWIKESLNVVNKARALHGVEALQWSDECYIFAQKQADACAALGRLQAGSFDGPSGEHGQALHVESVASTASPSRIFDLWYKKGKDTFPWNKPGFTPESGNFSQMVWKGTKYVGMATDKSGKYWVANFLPVGNVPGEHAANVLPPGKA
eukprot:TRINITY_DN26149_c0_g1_i2.p1 TRINITY_DN26149_c0_g1~~TRINITY_DN26149_c0_g1_i2.p1  ORF type:complete len:318 (+),score=49.45 TRINITY_DN26149_c0_g1_i2:76-954(+)